MLLLPLQPNLGFTTSNQFPVGHHFIYDSWIEIWSPHEAYGDSFVYIFEDWLVDQTNGTVNCTCMLPTGNETRIDHYQNIPVDIINSPPLMTNVTNWFLNGVVWIRDDDYNIVNETSYIYNIYDGYIEIPCFRLMNITWSGDYVNITILQYDSELGVLLSIFQETSFNANGTRVATADFFLVYSTFVALLDLPTTPTSPSTTTTPIVPTTPDSTTPTLTSSPTPGTGTTSTGSNTVPNYSPFTDPNSMLLRGAIILAITVEIVIIILLIRRRYSISDS